MKKIIESELISIAHRILKLKDKADIDALYNESKNVFEKISVLKFYEDNKFRIDPLITEENIKNALFNEQVDNSDAEITRVKNIEMRDTSMNLDLINELIEDSENSEIISFEDNLSFVSVEENSIKQNREVEVFEIQIETVKISEELKEEIPPIENIPAQEVQNVTIETVQIDPVFDMPIDEIFFEKVQSETESQNVIPEEEKHPNFENQHLLDVLEKNEIPFHEIPLNKTINDAFSHMITVGLNDRIAFEKNLFNGSSEDLNRVISQLNTIETFPEAKDFIEDLVKPDFNYWKGKEEYEERFMELIQKRF
ncbi:hypothetical protein EG240_03265 [Paenimyroides tangerinum]|uniref:Uncharacterized protein n=1 Tax=Paenimyroides tangerinum TaxID=2488728 RepID=A0A3P3WEE3_9FLAO|nr:hypothetical protein [Paenimyroides tangerinum]RRJ92436.1 hypothetical protein EG240_03265 [Paenimyroides tangerinum]